MDELTYELLAPEPIMWGRGTKYLVQETTIGDRSWTTQDSGRPNEDGTDFGLDFLTGDLWSWSLTVRGDDTPDAIETLRAIRAAWLGNSARRVSGAVLPLRLRYVGSTARRMYGRPRKCTPVLGRVDQWKMVPLAMDFQAVDHKLYNDDQGVLNLTTLPPAEGGLIFPTTFPTLWGTSTTLGGDGIQAGDEDAWPVITFAGPVTNPSVQLFGQWTLALTTSIGAGETITVDTQPWARTVLRSAGGSAADALTRVTPPLGKLTLPPGPFTVAYTGTDPTGTSSMTFAWRDAYSSI